LYRKYLYILSGGNERNGELLEEGLDTEKTFEVLDPHRKVRKNKETFVADRKAISISLGTEWGAIASAWLIEAERKLIASVKGIGSLTNGFVTGAVLHNTETGEISAPLLDSANRGYVQISHLSTMFRIFEVCAEIIDNHPVEIAERFEKAWLEYCRYFNGTAEDQVACFGTSFGNLQLRQGHSRLTAYAAKRLGDRKLARRAFDEFLLEGEDGASTRYGPETEWERKQVLQETLAPVDEASWISANIAAIQNIALLEDMIDQ